MRPKPYADCPEESTLQEVAAEMASPETSARILQHASQCDHCGPLLSQYLEDFSDELSPEIEALIDQLPFSQPQWQREKAKEIVASSTPKWKRLWNRTAEWISASKVRATAGATATLVVVIGIASGPPILQKVKNKKANDQIREAHKEIVTANKLFAAAYVEKEKRTLEPRLTGVGYAPYQPPVSTLGSGDISDNRPALDELRGKVSRKFDSGDEDKLDPEWWQIKGRELLLLGSDNPKETEKYAKKAAEYFEKARDRGVKDLRLDIDLAVAYLEEGSTENLENAAEKLETVLKSTDPAPTQEEETTALYNLGLAYENINVDLAVPTWEKYLKADPTGSWAEDVRRRLDDDKKKALPRKSYLNPSDYNAHSREPGVIRDVEQSQQIALERSWLPPAIEDPASEAGKAATSIARTLRLQHCDPMLTDLLAFPGKGGVPPAIRTLKTAFTPGQNNQPAEAIDCSKKVAGLFATRADLKDGLSLHPASAPPPNDGPKKANDCPRNMTEIFPASGPSAIQALSAAFAYTKNDRQEEAIGCSRKAAELFVRRGNLAGELLAGYQEIYALQRELDADGCLEQLDKLWVKAFASQYYWLQGELALEKAICANLAFKTTTTERSLKLSADIAKDLNFPELSLRIAGMNAGIELLNGEYDEARRDALDGMAQYWKGEYSSERYYQFVAVMRSIAVQSGHLHTSEAYLRRSIDILETMAPEDTDLKFVLYLSLANLLQQMDEDTAAEVEAKHARDLIATKEGRKSAVAAYVELPTIELADFELSRHRPALALSTLKPIGDTPQTRDKFARRDFYRVRGDAKLQAGHFDEASEDYQRGIHVAQEFFNQPTNNEIKRLSWVKATNRIYAGLVQVLLAKDQSEKALKVWEWSKFQLLNRDNTRLLKVVVQADSLPLPRTAYPHIIYASFEDRLQIWLVKDGHTVEKSVPVKQSELKRRIRDFNSNCQNKDSLVSAVEKQEAELYEVFLRPIIAELGSSDMVAIEFDDTIPFFAIEALKSPVGSYFADDYVVLHSPGILADTYLREPVPLKPQGKFLVVDALPDKGSEAVAEKLPLEVISRIYSTTVLQGADLSPQSVDKEMQTSDALLITSHGVRGNEGMGLKMTPDWSLRAKDFTQHVDRLRLAVLAACSSGYSENGLQDPDNMVRSLLASKVPNVIASRWDVDSQSTGELFEKFYTNLARGETPAQALRHARRDLRTAPSDPLHARPQRTHPYYWAGFYLTGKAN